MNSLSQDSLKDVLSFLSVNQLLCARRVCWLWKQAIESMTSRFETCSIGPIPEKSPFLVQHINIHNKLLLPAPFHKHLKRLCITGSAYLAKLILQANAYLVMKNPDIELDIITTPASCEESTSWLIRYHGLKIKKIRITFINAVDSDIAYIFKTQLASDCEIWVRIEALDMNFSTFYQLSGDSRLKGLTDMYGRGTFPRDLMRLHNRHPLREVSVRDILFHGPADWHENFLKDIGFHKETLNSLFLIFEIPTLESERRNFNKRIADFIDSLPNLEELKFKWNSGMSSVHTQFIMGKAAQTITSLTLDFPMDGDKTLGAKLLFATFPKLKKFAYICIHIDLQGLFDLLASMPVLDRFELYCAQISARTKQEIADICNATSAHSLLLSTVDPILKQELRSKAFRVSGEGDKITVYDVYNAANCDLILVRRCFESASPKRQKLDLKNQK